MEDPMTPKPRNQGSDRTPEIGENSKPETSASTLPPKQEKVNETTEANDPTIEDRFTAASCLPLGRKVLITGGDQPVLGEVTGLNTLDWGDVQRMPQVVITPLSTDPVPASEADTYRLLKAVIESFDAHDDGQFNPDPTLSKKALAESQSIAIVDLVDALEKARAFIARREGNA